MLLGILEMKEEERREFVGITGGVVNFQTSVELQLKLIDFCNKMKTVQGKFLINDASEILNIMGLDILSKAEIVINGQDGTWKFENFSYLEAARDQKTKEHFVELGDNIFQTIEIAKPNDVKIITIGQPKNVEPLKNEKPKKQHH